MKESRNHGLVSKNGKTKQRTMLSFRIDLAKDLISDFRQNKKRKVTDTLPDLKPENGHWPRKIQKKGRCRNCSKHGLRREPSFVCLACSVASAKKELVFLCPDCFQEHHENLSMEHKEF